MSAVAGLPMVVPLDEPAGLDMVGGKTVSLTRLRIAGLPVPDGFTVTTAGYRAFVAVHGLQEQILHGPTERIATLFASHPMPNSVAAPIRAAYAAMGAPAVIVRSSATAEDLPELSFAGQQDSFVDVRGAEAVLDAVRRCWASLWTERAVAYRRRQGIDPAAVALAVVVQELVDADAAGVLFTVEPVTGAADRMVVNATWGLGESLVGGRVTPDELVLDAHTGSVRGRRIGDKAIETVRTSAGTTERAVPRQRRRAPVLDDAAAAELGALGRRIAELYERPMDIEWTRDGGRFAIVQARPVTALRDPWNDSLTGDYLWTSTNLGEAIPDVLTPCTWSLVQIFMRHAMATASLPEYRGYGRVGGRFYFNLSVSAALTRAVGINERGFRSLSRNTFGRLPDEVSIPSVPLPRLEVLRRVLPIAIGVMRQARRLVRQLPAFVAANPQRCSELAVRIGAAVDPSTLARLWDTELRPLLETASDMLSAAGRSDPVALLTVEQRLRRLVGAADATALVTGLTVDGDRLASLGPLVGLALLERGEIDRDTYARRYGHRSPHEFEVSLPRPIEQPGWFEQQLAGLRAAASDPLALLERQEAAHRAAWARLAAAHPRAVRRTRRRLRRWARAERGREQARSEVVRVFAVLRAFALRAAELTGLGEAVFMLGIDEIIELLRGEPAPATEERRAAYERYRELPRYPTLIRGRFDPFAWAADPHRRTDRYDATATATAAPEGVLTGFPGAAGTVEGPARVLASVDEGAALQPDEILVTTVANVGWTPLFPRAAAIVTDVGAPLSHATIIARELGIPAVVGCGNATALLHTGDRVRVDGSRGTVELLE